MKKKDVINLIKYHVEKNDNAFRNQCYGIAKDFDVTGDYDLAEYIMALLSDANTFVPQMEMNNLKYCKKINIENSVLPLPDLIQEDIKGIINAIGYKNGINKFLFQGDPGTGKTETAKQIARLTDRILFIVDFNLIIDGILGQTGKNIDELFKEINSMIAANNAIILFDEIDAIALDRTNKNDLREMGRATSSILKGLDSLRKDIVIIATTNLYRYLDKALLRRFDAVVDFNRYSQEELVDVAQYILNDEITKYPTCGKDNKLFKKIINMYNKIPYPGDLKNMIRTSLAFSSPKAEYDYLRRMYYSINNVNPQDVFLLKEQGFTVREIERLTGISKSTVAREVAKTNE